MYVFYQTIHRCYNLIISGQSYRAIYKGHFDDNSLSHGARGGIRKHRHRGKTSHQTIQLQENKLNNRPRNEVFYGESMYLI